MPGLKIIVLGGQGYLGKRVVAALERATGVQVDVAGRKARLAVDLRDPATFGRVHGADVVIDLASSPEASPEALANYCIKQGITLIETSADRSIMDALPDQLREVTGTGHVVLGAGIFPGLSNLVARAAAGGPEETSALRLGISSSLFSGAGRATIDLMAAALSDEATSYRDGEVRFHPRMIEGEKMPFPTGMLPTVLGPMADVGMVRGSTGVPDLAVYLSPRPAWAQTLLLATPGWLRTRPAFRKFSFYALYFLRRILLAATPSSVELVAVAKRKSGAVRRVTLSTMDGMSAAGAAIAAIALTACDRRNTMASVAYVDQVMGLEETVARLNRLVPPGAEVRVDGAEVVRGAESA